MALKKQKIIFDFDWSILTILADFNGSLVENEEDIEIRTFSSSPIKKDLLSYNNKVSIKLHNISKYMELNNYVPIQYYDSNDHVNIFLLEETNYKLIFQIKSSKVSLDDVVLLREFHSHKPEIFNENNIDKNIKIIDFNFRSHVGEQVIDLIFDNIHYKLPIEIRSRKMNYENEYPAMISDLAKYASSILFDKNGSLFHNYHQYDRKKETKYEDYMLLEYIFKSENLPTVQEYLSKNLLSILNTFTEEVPLDFAYNINEDALYSIVSNPHNIIKSSKDNYLFEQNNEYYLPLFIDEIKYEDKIDNPENRFYKYFLEYIRYLVSDLKKDEDINGFIEERLVLFENMINNYLSRDFFLEISKLNYIPFNSQVLQKKEGYRDILKYFLILKLGYKINCDLISNEINGFEKRLSQIYEYWCFFKLYELINELTYSDNNYINFINDDWSLNIEKGFINTFRHVYDGQEIKISLAYQQEFSKYNTKYATYSLDMYPDFSISIEYDDNICFIHFDAKYRVEDGKPNPADIQKMHTYKDSIEYSIASFVLFPGEPNFKSIYNERCNQMKSVGAFSLNPINYKQEMNNIREYLISIIDRLINS